MVRGRETSEEALRGLLAAAPDALVAVDIRGDIVLVNDQAERMFGWPRADLVGRPVEVLVPARFAELHPKLRGGYTANPTTRPMGEDLELWARRRDGSEFPAEISLSAFDTSGGMLVAAAIRDVTRARRTEHRLRAVLASAPDAIVGVDASGRIELVNAQMERLFGWTAEELIGQQVEVLVPEAVVDAHIAHRAAYMRDPRARPMGAGVELSGRRKDGSSFPAEISLSAVQDEPGGVLVLAAIRDVSERIELAAERQRRALEAQRERSHRLESLGELAGGVAHDFNNLLGVILNYTTLLGRRIKDPALASDVAEIHAAAERAAGLTRQLLTFASRDVAHPEPLELNDVVRGVASMLARTLGEQIELQLDLGDGPVVAVADRHQLELIVLNLAINARDAMADGGCLTIATEAVETDGRRQAVLRVIDTGAGMPPEVVARAFEPFFTTKQRGQGTGLGLATVYGVVRQTNGDVRIDSTLGAGTTVTVVLPGALEAARRREGGNGTFEGGHERILLVEDEKALRVGTARILTAHGYDVVVASDGVEAMEVFDSDGPTIDLVVTDVVMPRMRGDELGRLLFERRPEVPVIFMSGYDFSAAPMTGRLLTKPVDEETLLRAVREAMNGAD
jgi:PAS domain S-box-containing protein